MAGDGTSKSAASRRFVALSAERLAEWMATHLSKLDLLIIQIDGAQQPLGLVGVVAQTWRSASLPLPISTSTYTRPNWNPSAAPNRSSASRCASMPSPDLPRLEVETRTHPTSDLLAMDASRRQTQRTHDEQARPCSCRSRVRAIRAKALALECLA
jgi:hypothetical protein